MYQGKIVAELSRDEVAVRHARQRKRHGIGGEKPSHDAGAGDEQLGPHGCVTHQLAKARDGLNGTREDQRLVDEERRGLPHEKPQEHGCVPRAGADLGIRG